MKKLTLIIAAIICAFPALTAQHSQQAEKMIADILAEVKKDAVKTDFILTFKGTKSGDNHSAKGTFILKDKKFRLEMDDVKVWFNGKTQWAFQPQMNEVSITEPSESELAETNPMAILSSFKNKCSIQFSKTKSTQFHLIEMKPKAKNDDIASIDVKVSKKGNTLQSIVINNKNGSRTELVLTNYQKKVAANDNTFIFNTSQFRGVEINDLR